jgi:2-amino-4-hydroxy-6-hydroxymethyldihydropteridine diphosphokinase
VTTTTYLIALGSNRRGRHGAPAKEVLAAARAIGARRRSPVIETPPIGPSIRRFANAAAWVESDLDPRQMLARLKKVEREFGRRPGQRWGARVIDLDIVLWSGGVVRSRRLTIPHPAFRERDFVLAPLAAIVPGWRDPATGLTVRQLHARLTRRARLPSCALRAGAGP